jgi:2-amino-4-hydroxy-6-hydroxymethyldihydropteridine diphosphokinase
MFPAIQPINMSITFIALGTNLGDRIANLRAAIDAMPPVLHVLAESHIYETPPWGYVDQPAFLNMAIKAETKLSARALLDHLKQLEQTLGRTPTFHYGPRRIDLDILFYADLIVDTPPLIIPHPRLHERAFVLVPLMDLAPDLVHPVLKQAIRELSSRVDQTGVRRVAGL